MHYWFLPSVLSCSTFRFCIYVPASILYMHDFFVFLKFIGHFWRNLLLILGSGIHSFYKSALHQDLNLLCICEYSLNLCCAACAGSWTLLTNKHSGWGVMFCFGKLSRARSLANVRSSLRCSISYPNQSLSIILSFTQPMLQFTERILEPHDTTEASAPLPSIPFVAVWSIDLLLNSWLIWSVQFSVDQPLQCHFTCTMRVTFLYVAAKKEHCTTCSGISFLFLSPGNFELWTCHIVFLSHVSPFFS
jgi:hypothetical protein